MQENKQVIIDSFYDVYEQDYGYVYCKVEVELIMLWVIGLVSVCWIEIFKVQFIDGSLIDWVLMFVCLIIFDCGWMLEILCYDRMKLFVGDRVLGLVIFVQYNFIILVLFGYVVEMLDYGNMCISKGV